MMNPKIMGIAAELRQYVEKLYGDRLVQMVVFGSQARGDAVEGSDIDILVVLKGPVTPGKEIARTGEGTAALSLKYNIVISCTFVSSDRYETERSPLLMNVRREGVAL
jgi:predicted nucleotidyltransferase